MSTVTVENILRRLRENLTLTSPRPLFNVVLDATLEVRNSVVYATFVVAMVFVPGTKSQILAAMSPPGMIRTWLRVPTEPSGRG